MAKANHEERINKAIDDLYQAIGESQRNEPGFDNLESIYSRAVARVKAHPIERVVRHARPGAPALKLAGGQ